MILYFTLLDDFFTILSPTVNMTIYNQQFNDLYAELNLTSNHLKDIIGTIADFLKIEFDSILIQTRLPPDKLARARIIVKNLLNSVTISYKKLELAIDFLTFIVKIVIPDRAFLRRLFDALRRPVSIYHIISDIKADL